jgi:phytoene/squalene synthetase
MNSEREYFLSIFNSIDFQQIKDHPNILIAANFWEDERFQAAKVCYKFLRAIDDLIDDHKTKFRDIAPAEQEAFRKNVEEWLKMLISAADNNPLQKELADTIQAFRIPLWPMEAFAKSMMYDIDHNGFPTMEAYLEYSMGASVAPASVFVHLAGLSKDGEGYTEPRFDVKEAAIPCAIFSYLVHIIRDFQKDQLSNLNYFADDLILKYNLSREKLYEFASGVPVNMDFRRMMEEYCELADHYRIATYGIMQKIRPRLEPRYQLSLEIIFGLYQMVFEKINPATGSFTKEELNPTPEETRDRVLKTILEFSAV